MWYSIKDMKRKAKVVNTWNTYDGKFGVSYYLEGERKVAIKECDWYFAIETKHEPDVSVIKDKYNWIAHFKKDEKFPDYAKVYCKREIGQAIAVELDKLGIITYEADLMQDKRWFIDQNVEISDRYDKLYFDIETDDTNELIVIGGDRILSFAAVDFTGKKFFYSLEDMTDESEIKLLKKIINLFGNYDIILGWYSKGFDIPYIRTRVYKLHKAPKYDDDGKMIEPGNRLKNLYFDKVKIIAHYDLLDRFRHIFRFDNHLKKFNLDFIGNYFLGKGKVDHTGDKIIDLYRNNKPKLKEYNLEDCILVKELDEKLGVSDMMIRQCQWCGVPASQFGLYSIIDSYILKMAHGVGKFGKTSIRAIAERSKKNERGNQNSSDTYAQKHRAIGDDEEESGPKYLGAIVLDPKVGMYGRVYVFDFKSLYPSMMRTSNIGYDTLQYEANDSRIINPGTLEVHRRSGKLIPTYFDKEPSVINLAITNLLKKRTEYKNLKLKMIEDRTNKGPEWDRVVSDEIIVKELSNSTYGIMGLEYGRYFDVDIAESITLFGQWMILYSRDYFNSIGYNVIYGDTDSVFVETGGREMDLDKELKIYHEVLGKVLKEKYNIDESFIQLNFDKQYEALILIAKKSYTGHVVNIEGKKTDDIYARGLEFIKKNTFSFASVKQKELVDLLLHKKITTPEECIEWTNNTKYEFNIRDFTVEELTLLAKVNKPIDSYKSTPLHVELIKALQERTGRSYTNVEIEYIITPGRNGTKMSGVLAEDFTGEFDREYYWTNKTQPVLQRITDVAFPGFEIFPKKIKAVRVKKVKDETPKVRKPRKKKEPEDEQLSLF